MQWPGHLQSYEECWMGLQPFATCCPFARSWCHVGSGSIDEPPPSMFIDFTSATGAVGTHFKGWEDGSMPAAPRPSVGELQSKGSMVHKDSQRMSSTLWDGGARPRSHMIAMYSGCMALPWPSWRIEAIDDWLLSMSAECFRRQTKPLESLPVPSRNQLFPELFFTSCA